MSTKYKFKAKLKAGSNTAKPEMVTTLKKSLILSTALMFSLFITACGGGGGGSQDPDPVLVDLPIAYVKRPLPVDVDDEDNDGDVDELLADDIFEPNAFRPGAALFIRDRAAGSANETNITDRAWMDGDLYDVKDVEASFDGSRLVFAMRAPDDPDINDPLLQPKWDIWEYNRNTDVLRRVIDTPATAQEANDIAPHYLPDGRIVFSSDRQQISKAILLDDGKTRYAAQHEGNAGDGEYAFNLHVMSDDGTDIDQITFNQSHDLYPSVLSDGRIVFLRWDRYNNNNLSLYTVNPYGMNLQFLYGFHSQNTGTNDVQAAFSKPREMPDGRILVNLRTRVSDRLGGDLVLIDAANYTEIDRPTATNTGATDPGQASGTLLDVFIDGTPSPHGHFNSAYPFFDDTNRLLVSWNQCRLVDPLDPDPVNPTTFLACTDENLQDPAAIEAEPLYGIWIYNPIDGTQLPVVLPEEDLMYTDLAAMDVRIPPAYITEPRPGIELDQDLLDEAVGVVHIRSVYDLDGVDTSAAGIEATRDPGNSAFDNRAARFLRIIKAVSQPDDETLDFDNNAFGVAGAQRMKEIIGYVPIEPDGSVMFKVPANIAFNFSVVNAANARIMPRHQNWLQVRSGEVVECNGCHSRQSELPHGRQDAQYASANPGAPTTGQPFSNTDPALFADMGESMAEVWARINGPREPTVDIIYTDEWSATPDPNDDINLLYNDMLIGSRPASNGCINNWSALCRVIINYEDHIQPLWVAPRTNDSAQSAICTDCHNRVDPNNANAAQVPAGQLELTETPSNDALSNNGNIIRVKSYQDLFAGDVALELNAGANGLQRQQINDVDDEGNPIVVDVLTPAPIPNGRFAQVFGPGGTHDGTVTRLNPAELKLISEWLDIGAQYFNNPFDAPLN